MKLELLSPAKNLDYGREAINHGADAVYIGAPAFGARAAATNSIEEIDRLVHYAHLYGAKVFATVNTILFDDELEPAVRMIGQLYNAGVDALIVQDMGLLECGLPPIELHASTQCHNSSVEKVRFLEGVGFRRVILARETSLGQMQAIRQHTGVELEAFVHGALCVSYSGQCYMSQYLNGRSGNRGCCSQPCRSTYDLTDTKGRTIVKDRHLLSLRDLNASQQLQAMIEAGISSFKIEGRLKDLGYVKNITAYYRQLLDQLMEGHERASGGSCTFRFEPDPDRTFNRGYTEYFLRERQPMASLETQKSIGKYMGRVSSVGSYNVSIDTPLPFANGDGLCFMGPEGTMHGFLVNEVHGNTVVPNHMPSIKVGTRIWRNNDQVFEKQLQANSAERKIGVNMLFCVSQRGFSLDIKDEDGLSVVQHITAEHQEADKPLHNTNNIKKQLGKVGNTPYRVDKITDATEGRYFVASSIVNELRRKAIALLTEHRISHFHPEDSPRIESEAMSPAELDYRANVVNDRAEKFYKKHGTRELERGVEETLAYGGKAVMTTKYCLRYELGCCLQGKNTHKPQVNIRPTDQLLLRNNGKSFRLSFDCKECLMRLTVDDGCDDHGEKQQA